MKRTLDLLRDAGYDNMPMAKDACGRRIGDGGIFVEESLARDARGRQTDMKRYQGGLHLMGCRP